MIKLDPMLIILEGVDNSGKTFLSEYASKQIPGMVTKFSIRPKTSSKSEIAIVKDYWWSWIRFMQDNSNKMFWMDRFFMSEGVYSLVKRGYDAFQDPEMKDLEREIKGMKHLVVYCYPGLDTLKERYAKEGDEHIQMDDLEALLVRYEQWIVNTSLNTLVVDTNKSPEEVTKLIAEKCKELYEHTGY